MTRAALPWLALAAVVYVVGPRAFALDDPYISLHSARVALSGAADPVFGSPALTGVTSPLYVALLMGLLSIGFQHGVEALRAATALGVAAQAAGLWYLARRVGLRSSWLRAALVVAGCGSGWIWINATNGLETGWAMAVLTWMIAASPDRLFGLALGAGLLPVLRPDLAPASLALLIVASSNRSWRDRMLAAGVAAGAAAPFLLWVYADTGHWLPQTMRAKYLFRAEACAPAMFKARTAAAAIGVGLLTMLPASLGLLALWKDRLGRAGLCAMACSLAAIAWTLPNSLWFNDFRYLFPIIAPWAAYGVAQFLARARAATGTAAALTIAVVCWAAFLNSVRPDSRQAIAAERIAAAAWIDEHTPADAILGLHDAGVMSEFAHRRAVDVVGLKTPASMVTHAAMTFPSCSARQSDAIVSILDVSRADYLVLQTDWGSALNLEPAAAARGLTLIPVRAPVAPYPFGQNVYRLDRSAPPTR